MKEFNGEFKNIIKREYIRNTNRDEIKDWKGMINNLFFTL